MKKHLILRGFLLIGERTRRRKNRAGEANGAQGRNRTTDTAIFSRMLYQLSYLGVLQERGQGPSSGRFIVGWRRPVHPASPEGLAGRSPAVYKIGAGVRRGSREQLIH